MLCLFLWSRLRQYFVYFCDIGATTNIALQPLFMYTMFYVSYNSAAQEFTVV